MKGNIFLLHIAKHFVFINTQIYVFVETKAKLSNLVIVFCESDIWWFLFNSHGSSVLG